MGRDLSPALDDAARISLFRTMVLIRTFEEAVLRAARAQRRTYDSDSGLAPADLRLSAGHEPVAVGVCAHLDSRDALTAAHRPHHLAIAHGVDSRKLVAETLGQTRADSELQHRWHLFDPDTDFTSAATIAEGYPPALGRAFAFQQRDAGRVAVAVTDRTAASQDGFREALDLATLWSLPLVFIVEDDDWGDQTPRSVPYLAGGTTATSTDYGVPAERVEDNAIETIYEAAGRSVERARAGGGPSVLELHTVRLWTHVHGRLPEFRAQFIDVPDTDPLPTYERALRTAGVLDSREVARAHSDATDRVAEAIGNSENSSAAGDNESFPTYERKAAT